MKNYLQLWKMAFLGGIFVGLLGKRCSEDWERWEFGKKVNNVQINAKCEAFSKRDRKNWDFPVIFGRKKGPIEGEQWLIMRL